MLHKIEIRTKSKQEIIDITQMIEELVKKNKWIDGVCFIYCPHTTCGVAINEGADPSVKADIINKLSELIPTDGDYLHLEGNSHSHIKSILTGNSISIFIENNKLELGRWQSIYLLEFDGPRNRNILVKFLKSTF
ncbi:MAG: secondary thiamine-phosphate synthase enzyme YjbQ [Elusimicrobiota bacterium]